MAGWIKDTTPSTFRIVGFSTMNNVKNKVRLDGPTIGNPVALSECTNISNADITDINSLSIRDGITKTYTGTPHSMWATPDGTHCYFVEGSYLKELLPTFTTASSIRILTAPTLPMSYTQLNYITICSNGVDLFLIENGVASSFEFVTERFKEEVSAGHLVAIFNRRLYIAINNAVYYTDADDIQRLDERDDPFVFNDRIHGIYPMEHGIYVMADKVYYLQGSGPDEFVNKVAFVGRLIEGCATVYDGTLVKSSGKRIRFVTTDSICDGDDAGNITVLSKGVFSFTPIGQQGSAIVKNKTGYSQFIVLV